jgi:Predicted integral membrane protein (DUF2269)
MLASISAYTISIWIHVSAAVIGFGSTFAGAVAFPLALRTYPRHVPFVHHLSLAINRRLATPALAVVIITGFYQVAKGNWKMSSFWISATLLIAIVLGGLIGAYFIPTDRKLGEMAERELVAAGGATFTPSEEYTRLSQREGTIGAVAGVLIVIALFLMITKP